MPLAKSYKDLAIEMVKRPRYLGGVRWSDRLHWSSEEMFDLAILTEGGVEIGLAADALGRSETSIAWRARGNKMTLPLEWARRIAPKRRRAAPQSLLAYPYVAKAKPENLDLLAINAMIPRGVPEHARADMVQEIMVAVLEGRTTIEALQSNGRSTAYFMRKFYKDNYEDAGRAVSFDFADDTRAYDEAAAANAAREWHHSELNDRRNARDFVLQRSFTPPTQIEAVFNDQIGRMQMGLHRLGHYLSREEVEDWLDERFGR